MRKKYLGLSNLCRLSHFCIWNSVAGLQHDVSSDKTNATTSNKTAWINIVFL